MLLFLLTFVTELSVTTVI